jgi:homoserine kinase type II
MVKSPKPVLEMLWEPVDPARTLAERFGFADGPAAAGWVAETLDKHWGIRVGTCRRIVLSSGGALAWISTRSGPLLAKWSIGPGRFPWLAETARLTGWLQRRGLPVSAPVPARDGRLQVEVDGVSIGVQHEIIGDLLDTDDLDQVRAAGTLLARLHAELAAYPDAGRLPAFPGSERPLTTRIPGWLDAHGGHLPVAARDALRTLVAAAPPDELAPQPVHFDFRSANLLWAGDGVAAIIDFDEAQHEHRLNELARSAVLLGTRYHDWAPVPAEVRATFLAAYRSEWPLTPAEAAWLDILVLWQTLLRVPPGPDPTGWAASAVSQLTRP